MYLFLNKIILVIKVISQIKNFWTYFYLYFFAQSKTKKLLKFWNGLKIFAGSNRSNLGIINEIFFYNDYLKYYQGNPKIIIDIGANIGYFTLYAKKLFPQAKIYSFEPFPNNFEQLVEHIKINSFKDIFPIAKAVSAQAGTAHLNIVDQGGENTLESNPMTVEKISVDTISLADIFLDNKIETCQLLKIDCEGSEYDILYSLPKEFFPRICYITMETHFVDNKTKNAIYLEDFLKSQEFEVVRISLGACPYIFAKNKRSISN